jgi:hypothetical protein
VDITLYMEQTCWKSQYIYLLLNYHKLAFRRVSDLVFLDRASYFLELRKKTEQERWPAVKVVVALEPKVILSGIDPIVEFFRENQYFTEEMAPDKAELLSVEEFIDGKIVPYLDSLFWHPMLTYQYSFHTNLSSYENTSKDNYIFGIIGRNSLAILPRIARNLSNIWKEPARYRESKDKLAEGLNEIVKGCLKK